MADKIKLYYPRQDERVDVEDLNDNFQIIEDAINDIEDTGILGEFLTKAAYDALPKSKLYDGKLYFITDYSEGEGASKMTSLFRTAAPALSSTFEGALVDVMNKGTLIVNGIDFSNGGPGGGSTGTNDYSELLNKPAINGRTLTKNTTLSEIGALPSSTTIPYADGTTITQAADGKLTVASAGVSDYESLSNKPAINGQVLDKNTTLEDIGAMSAEVTIPTKASDVGALPDTTIIPKGDGTTITQAEDGTLTAIGGGSGVEVSAEYTTGTKIATISIDDEDTDIYTPATDVISINKTKTGYDVGESLPIPDTLRDVVPIMVAPANTNASYTYPAGGLSVQLTTGDSPVAFGFRNIGNYTTFIGISDKTFSYSFDRYSGTSHDYSVYGVNQLAESNGVYTGQISPIKGIEWAPQELLSALEAAKTYKKIATIEVPVTGVTPILTEGVEIGTITVNEEEVKLYAPEGGGSTVEYVSELTDGTKIGTLTIDDEEHDILVPTNSGYEEWIGTKAEYEAQKDNIDDGTIVNITDDNGSSGAGSGSIEEPEVYDLASYATSPWQTKTRLTAIKWGRIIHIHLEGKITVTASTVLDVISNLPDELQPLAQQDLSMMNFNNYVCRAWAINRSIGMYTPTAMNNLEINIHGSYVSKE